MGYGLLFIHHWFCNKKNCSKRDIDFGFYLFHPHYFMFLGGNLHFGI